jgi:hypothetical protein
VSRRPDQRVDAINQDGAIHRRLLIGMPQPDHLVEQQVASRGHTDRLQLVEERNVGRASFSASGSFVASALIHHVDLSCCSGDRMADLVTNDPQVLGRPPERKSTGRKHGVLPVGSLISRAGRLPLAARLRQEIDALRIELARPWWRWLVRR